MRRYFDLNKLYRDPVHSKITGVCAGLAQHWDVPRLVVRVVAVGCLIAMPMVTAVAYVTATILIASK
jgi:phage shock protein PspC (stress-responsive transcriptional regulator)